MVRGRLSDPRGTLVTPCPRVCLIAVLRLLSRETVVDELHDIAILMAGA